MSAEEEKNSRRDEADSFWDVDGLMPRTRRRGTPAPRSHTEAVEIGDASDAAATNAGTVRIPPRGTIPAAPGKVFAEMRDGIAGEKPELEYEPEGTLIHRVCIMRWHTGYSYYEQFLHSAAQLEHQSAAECPRVPFFSYMPQYSQLDRSQLAFYLWWREEVRRGNAPQADYSYVLLYIYELINLYSGTPGAGAALDRLCFIWAAYREEYPRLDVQLSEWVCDLCLINRLDIHERLGGIPAAAYLGTATLREFYIDTHGGAEEALLTYCSNYDWHKSRYASGEAAPFYAKHMTAAAAAALRACRDITDRDGKFMPGMRDTRAVRDAYVGALCSPRAKKRIYVDYCSFSRSHETRFMVTDILKYTENRLRAVLGIKSRLSFGPLPTEARAAVDSYFASEFLPSARRAAARKPEPTPEYEKLYDPLPENNTLSFENASRIESESWQTTDRLIEAFADDTEAEPVPEPPAEIHDTICDEPQRDTGEGLGAALGEYLPFVLAALDGDMASERAFAAARGALTDAVADTVNDIAAGEFGDIILEESGGAWRVMKDYADELRTALTAEGH